MPKFEREDRYAVIKIKDAKAALSEEQLCQLDGLLIEIDQWRNRHAKRPLKCVVVEDDWPQYEQVWALLGDTEAHAPRAKERPEWTGPCDGLPYPRMTCLYWEGFSPKGSWREVSIIGTDLDGRAVFQYLDSGAYGSNGDPSHFKRIKSEREEIIEKMVEIINDGHASSSIEQAKEACGRLYDAGYDGRSQDVRES